MTILSRINIAACVGAALLFAACAQVPPKPVAEETAEARAARAHADAADAPERREREEPLPAHELTGQILYQLLLAEIGLQRGSVELSTSAYFDLARSTRDPRIARRAAEVALYGRDAATALQAARLWVEIDADSPQARQMLAGLLVSADRLDEIQPHVAKLLMQEGANVGDGLLRLNRVFARHPDKKAVMQLIEQLTTPYIGVAEAHFARAQAAHNAGAWAHGVEEIDRALVLRPDWDAAVILKAQLLQPDSAQRSLETLKAYVDSHPRAREVRLQYARGLAGAGRFQESRSEFQRLLGDYPDSNEVIYAVGLLSMQLREFDMAETSLRKLLDLDFSEASTVRLYLGQIAEERKRPEEAVNWYSQVTQGAQRLPAQLRIARVLSKQGKVDEARRLLHELAVSSEDERIQVILAETQLLRDAARPGEAFELLERALDTRPNQTELLYEAALLADKMGRLDVLEANLRKVISLNSEHAHAHNALGYSFVERNQRLPEARELILKALRLAPEDPFIIDSMGWVLYRMGDHAGALVQLQRAFAIRQDPEIAAHLGEVLWMLNRREEAKATWRDAAKANPDNETLVEVIKRFGQ